MNNMLHCLKSSFGFQLRTDRKCPLENTKSRKALKWGFPLKVTHTLNNNQQDSSLMSQFMSYAFNQAGPPVLRCAYAK